MKTCSTCKAAKPEGEFSISRAASDGLQHACKACDRARCAARTQSRPTPDVKHCSTCRGAKPAANFGSNRTSVDGLNATCKACTKAYNQTRYRENRGSFDQRSSIWRRSNPEAWRSIQNRSRRGNLQADIARVTRRHAALAAAPGSHTEEQWAELKEAFGHRCICCMGHVSDLPQQKLTKDHIVAIKLGGSNDIDNIQPLCISCNAKKHQRTIDYRPAFEIRLSA